MNPGGRLLLSPGDRVAGYEVDSYVARGGMAVVYRARDVALGRWVALKLIAPEFAENEKFRLRFMRESEMAASIEHPNILPIYQAGEAEGLLFIAMRFVDGLDLGKVMAAHTPLPAAVVLPLFTQVAAALDTAHAHGLVHRDVKPGNMLVAGSSHGLAESHIYLSDFGLTKRSSSLSGLTTAGHFMGTIAYVAPEQIQAGQVDHRADVYAMGCVIYEALTGVLPFHFEEESATLWAKMSSDPEPLTRRRPDLPPAVDDVLMRALARDPQQRTPSCRAVVAELRAAFRKASGAPVLRPADEPTLPSPAPPAPLPPTHRVGQPRSSPTSGPQQTPAPAPGPVAQEPAAQKPVAHEPAAQEPVAHQPVTAPRRALAILAAAVVIAVLAGAFVVWKRGDDDLVLYQGTSANASWLNASLAKRWGRHGTQPGMCFCSEHFGPAIESGDAKTWQRMQAIASDDPGYVDGMYVREIPGVTPPASGAGALDMVRAQLDKNSLALGEVTDVEVSGRPGWRVDGRLSARSNPDLTLDFHYYLVPREGAVDHLMLFTRSDRTSTFMPMAGRIVKSVRLT